MLHVDPVCCSGLLFILNGVSVYFGTFKCKMFCIPMKLENISDEFIKIMCILLK